MFNSSSSFAVEAIPKQMVVLVVPKPQAVVIGDDGQVLRGQSKKQFRAAMFKAKTVLDPKVRYHALGFRSDGMGVAQPKAKNSKPETVTEDQG